MAATMVAGGREIYHGALRKRAIDVAVLSDEVDEIDFLIINLIAKKIVEVSCAQDVAITKEGLLNSGFKGANALRLQGGVGETVGRSGVGFFEPGLLKAGGVRKMQACAGKNFASSTREKRQR